MIFSGCPDAERRLGIFAGCCSKNWRRSPTRSTAYGKVHTVLSLPVSIQACQVHLCLPRQMVISTVGDPIDFGSNMTDSSASDKHSSRSWGHWMSRMLK
jgi:hypothetical protein